MKNTLQNTIVIIAKVCFIALAFYLIFQKVSLDNLIKIIKDSNWLYLLIGLLASHISLVLSALRSKYYFQSLGRKFSTSFMVALYYIGTFFNLILPGGISGDAYKIYLIWKLENFSKLKSFRIMLYERTNGFYALCVLGLISFFFTSFKTIIPYSSIIFILILILITPTYLWGCKYILKDNIKTALIASLYSFGVQSFQLIMSFAIITALITNPYPLLYINFTFLFIIASILAIIPISIGGIGIRELTLLYGLELIGDTSLIESGISFALLAFFLYLLTGVVGLPLLYSIKNIKR